MFYVTINENKRMELREGKPEDGALVVSDDEYKTLLAGEELTTPAYVKWAAANRPEKAPESTPAIEADPVDKLRKFLTANPDVLALISKA